MDQSDDFMAAVNFDPFAEMSGSNDSSSQNNDSATTPQPQNPQPTGTNLPADITGQQPSQQAPQSPAPSGQPAGQPAGNSVQEFMEAMGRMPGGMPSPAQAPVYPVAQPQQPPQQAPQQQAPVTDYSQPYQPAPVQIPDQLMAAVMGQDPGQAAQALNHIVGTIYNSLREQMHTALGQVHGQLQALPQGIQQDFQLRQAQQEIYSNFYGKFPELNTDIGRVAVGQMAQRVLSTMQSMGRQVDPRSQDFLDYVGSQARLALNIQQAQPQLPQQKVPAQRPAQFQTGGASRAGVGGGNPFMESIGFNGH